MSALVGELEGLWRTIELTVGALLAVALITMSKVSLILPPLLSLAVTFTESVATSAAAGVPEKTRVAEAKVSQVGSAESSDCIAS